MIKPHLVASDMSKVFCFPYFIHAGVLDAITTLIALHSGFSELNPAVALLFPNYIVIIPAFLILLAYLRSLTVVLLFKNSRYFKPVMWFSLYFPGLFNMVGIFLFYYGQGLPAAVLVLPKP